MTGSNPESSKQAKNCEKLSLGDGAIEYCIICQTHRIHGEYHDDLLFSDCITSRARRRIFRRRKTLRIYYVSSMTFVARTGKTME
jgi:hypothetical protein